MNTFAIVLGWVSLVGVACAVACLITLVVGK
jgi:hypothetical protein